MIATMGLLPMGSRVPTAGASAVSTMLSRLTVPRPVSFPSGGGESAPALPPASLARTPAVSAAAILGTSTQTVPGFTFKPISLPGSSSAPAPSSTPSSAQLATGLGPTAATTFAPAANAAIPAAPTGTTPDPGTAAMLSPDAATAPAATGAGPSAATTHGLSKTTMIAAAVGLAALIGGGVYLARKRR